MPTLIELTGAEEVESDGISILPAILGNEHKNQERKFLYWEFEETDLAGFHPELVMQMIGIIRSEHTESPHFKVTLP